MKSKSLPRQRKTFAGNFKKTNQLNIKNKKEILCDPYFLFSLVLRGPFFFESTQSFKAVFRWNQGIIGQFFNF